MTQVLTETKTESILYTCAKGKRIKEFFFGSVEKYVWNEEAKTYIVAKKEKSIFLCDHCNQKCEGSMCEYCEFTDIPNIATEGETPIKMPKSIR